MSNLAICEEVQDLPPSASPGPGTGCQAHCGLWRWEGEASSEAPEHSNWSICFRIQDWTRRRNENYVSESGDSPVFEHSSFLSHTKSF